MSDNKTERQLNLLFLLLNTVQPLEREVIRKRIPGYSNKSDEAFERMFERDKEDLRELNIPIETVSIDIFQEDLFGYRIRKENWLLPELNLSVAERSMVNVAAAAWREAQLASAFTAAVKRIGTADIPDKAELPSSLLVDLANTSNHLLTIMHAKQADKCVSFSYLSKGETEVKERTVAPWRMFLSEGNAYLIGFDHDKGEARTFRLSRVVGNLSISNEDILEREPDDFKAAEVVADWRKENLVPVLVKLEIESGKLTKLRSFASSVEYGSDFDLIELQTTDLKGLAMDIARNCNYVRVIQPKELFDQVNNLIGGVQWQ